MMEQAEAIGATPDIVLVGASGGGLISGVSIAVKEKSPATVDLLGGAGRLRRPRPLAREAARARGTPGSRARSAMRCWRRRRASSPSRWRKRNLAGGLVRHRRGGQGRRALRLRGAEAGAGARRRRLARRDPGGQAAPRRARPSRPCCRAATSTPRCSPRSSRSSAKLPDRRMSARGRRARAALALPSASRCCLRPSSSIAGTNLPTCRSGSTGRASARARSPSSPRRRCSCAWRPRPSSPLPPTAPAIIAAS